MTRRMLDTHIWANEHFAGLPPMARLLQIGIINLADDQGRMKANPAYVRAQVFPYDDVTPGQVIEWLTMMAANGTVKLYEVGGKAYLQLVNWWEYQPLDWARSSEYPAPAGWKDHIRYNGKGGVHLCYNWMKRTGSLMDDTCDCRGNPLGATPSEPPAIPIPPTDLPPALPPVEVPAQVATPGSNADRIDQNRSRLDQGESSGARACVSEPPESPPLPEHLARMLEQINGHPTHYRPHVQVIADTYTEQARKLGIEPPSFSARITALASCVGQKSYIDAADDDAGTMNSLKSGVLTLAKLGYHTEADYRQLCESFATVNDWMTSPVPSLRQLTDHAGKVKDGVLGKDAKTRPRLPKPGPGGFYDFPTMAAAKAAAATCADIRNRVTVKGTKVSV